MKKWTLNYLLIIHFASPINLMRTLLMHAFRAGRCACIRGGLLFMEKLHIYIFRNQNLCAMEHFFVFK